MGLADLTQMEILYGSLSFLFVLISLLIGLRILLKYFQYNEKTMITVGLAWIFMTSGWWRITFNFPLVILFDIEMPHLLGIIIDSVFIPIGLLCWIYSFSNLAYPDSKKRIMSVYSGICIIYEVILIILIAIDPDLVINIISTFNSKYRLYPYLFSIFGILSFLVTGVLFTRQSLRSEDPRIHWKGRFLLGAFVLFTLGAVFDAGIMMDVLTLVLIRIVLITSAILYYMGFLLPDKIANWLIKDIE